MSKQYVNAGELQVVGGTQTPDTNSTLLTFFMTGVLEAVQRCTWG
jgi:hypothetical protein